MKKTNLLGALALASCVMLSGCDKKPSEETKEISIALAGLPEVAIIGQEINLEQYVTVENSSDFTIELASASASKASVSGHKLTASDEGDISFTVKAGDKSATGSILGRSANRQGIIDILKDAGHEYCVVDYGQENILVHGEGFILNQQWDYDEETEEYIPGGFLKFPEHDGVYPFTVTEVPGETEEDEPTYVVEAESSIYSNSYMEYFNSDINADFSSLTSLVRGFDADLAEEGEPPLEVLTLSGQAAADFAENSFMVPNGAYTMYTDETHTTTYSAPITKIEFFVDDIGELFGLDSLPVVGAYVFANFIDDETGERVEEIGDLYFLVTNPAFLGDEDVEAFIADPENIPAGDSSSILVKNFIETLVPNNCSFAVGYQYGWYDNAAHAYFDVESEEFEAFFAAEVEDTIFEDAPNGSSSRLFAENGIFNVAYQTVGTGEEAQVIPDFIDGVAQSVDTSGEEPVISVYEVEKGESGYGVYEAPEFEDIYAASDLSLSKLAKGLTGNSFEFKGTVPVGGTQENPVYGYVLALNLYEGYPFMDELFKSESGLVSLLALCEQYKSRMDIRSFFEGQVMVCPSYGMLAVHLELAWDAAGLYSYCVDFSMAYDPTYEAYTQTFINYILA